MSIFIGLLVATAAAASPPPVSLPTGLPSTILMSPDEARRIVLDCGLPEQSVSVSYEQDMREDVIWIASGKTSLPEPMLVCMARASLRTTYYIYFRDEQEHRRYSAVYERISRKMEVAEAREWLRQRNLLARIPLLRRSKPLADYAKAVEAFCGVRPGSLLLAQSDDLMTFAPGGLGHITAAGVEGAAATTEQFNCVMRVTSAADLRSKGIFFGFVGNATANDR